MCLQRIDPEIGKQFKRNKRGDVIAYKLFSVSKQGPLPSFMFASTVGRDESVWQNARAGMLWGGMMSGYYPAGFHAFATVAAAKKASLPTQAIRRVLLRGEMTFGCQWSSPAVAAKRMFVCKGAVT